jgi:hypothetical protein
MLLMPMPSELWMPRSGTPRSPVRSGRCAPTPGPGTLRWRSEIPEWRCCKGIGRHPTRRQAQCPEPGRSRVLDDISPEEQQSPPRVGNPDPRLPYRKGYRLSGGECPVDGLGIAGRVLDGPLVLERVDEPKSFLPSFAFCRLAVINDAARDGSMYLKKSSRALAGLGWP